MDNQRPDTGAIGFKSIQLFKDQVLGIGSYGKVCRATCDELLCAAKLIHETLFDPTAEQLVAPQREHRLPVRRFEQECQFLSTIRHPNVVQYLGIYQDPDTGLPVLLMELMDDSLTHFVESPTQPIPYHIAVKICYDIALALSYLHSNDIVHRDLSSNNVLLIGDVRAKVTDFGMARLGDQNPRATHLTFTMCPGTDVFMPPEAVRDRPVYTEKIDCFSFGVITLQMLTRKFPKPGDRRKVIEISHPDLPGGIAEVPVSEIERRQNHISEVDPDHPLLQVTLDCLKDRDVERPSAQQLCERVAALKESQEYGESVRATQERNVAEQGRREERERELRSLRQQHDEVVRQKDEVIAAGQEEMEQLRRENEQHAEVIVASQRQLGRKEDEIAQLRREKERVHQQLEENREEKNMELTLLRQQHAEAIAASQHGRDREQRQQVQGLQQIIQSQRSRLEEKDQSLREKEETIAASQQQLRQLQDDVSRLETLEREKKELIEEKEKQKKEHFEEIGRLEREKDGMIEKHDRQLEEKERQLEEKEQVIAEFQRRIDGLEQRRPAMPTTNQQSSRGRGRIHLIWKTRGKAPFQMSTSNNYAVADGTTAYIMVSRKKFFAYTVSTSLWHRLPNSPNDKCPLVIIDNVLTLVGGSSSGLVNNATNQLFSLTGEGSGRTWTEVFPAMPTKRYGSIALHTERSLIVAGGTNRFFPGYEMKTVEVMNTETLQWFTAPGIPHPLWNSLGTLCGDQIYILTLVSHSRSIYMYTCSVQSLLQSCYSTPSTGYKWKMVTSPPVSLTTCVSVCGRLLTIGGVDLQSNNKITGAIHMYDSTTNTWELISHMVRPRYQCCSVFLPNNQLMIVGGVTNIGETDSLEMATAQ